MGCGVYGICVGCAGAWVGSVADASREASSGIASGAAIAAVDLAGVDVAAVDVVGGDVVGGDVAVVGVAAGVIVGVGTAGPAIASGPVVIDSLVVAVVPGFSVVVAGNGCSGAPTSSICCGFCACC